MTREFIYTLAINLALVGALVAASSLSAAQPHEEPKPAREAAAG